MRSLVSLFLFLIALVSHAADVADYGAVCDGVTDSATAIQTAIDANLNGYVSLSGDCLISNTIKVTGPIRIVGVSRGVSSITWTGNIHAISIKTNKPVVIEGIKFVGNPSATSGSAIHLDGDDGGVNSFSIIRDCTFLWGYNQIVTTNAYAWVFENNYHHAYVNSGVVVQNKWNVDAGDSTITKSIFSGGGPNSISIIQYSSGGLRIVNNKLLDGATGYRLGLAYGALTSDLIIQGNSIENQTVAGISMGTAGGGATFANVVIDGNQFMNQPVAINLNDSQTFLSRVAITDNSIAITNQYHPYGIVITNTRNFIVAGNQIDRVAGTGVGIAIGSLSSYGRVTGNSITGTGTAISNGSATVTVN